MAVDDMIGEYVSFDLNYCRKLMFQVKILLDAGSKVVSCWVLIEICVLSFSTICFSKLKDRDSFVGLYVVLDLGILGFWALPGFRAPKAGMAIEVVRYTKCYLDLEHLFPFPFNSEFA